ncbi:MAG: hypothetical protein AAF597_08025 [Bacteroidota bacterium]
MKQDIVVPEVKDVIVAAVPRSGQFDEEIWDIHVINLRAEPMDNVLITSQGYGSIGGRDKTTTVLRHFHQQVSPNGSVVIEPIQRELFSIQNEYWVSFNSGGIMLDKRYVFNAGDINADALTTVPVLGVPGVMIS